MTIELKVYYFALLVTEHYNTTHMENRILQGIRRWSNLNHIQKTEVLDNEDAAIERLCAETVALVKHTRNIAVQQVNMIQLLTYYAIGKWIVDVQQNGESRARYGSHVIKRYQRKCKRILKEDFRRIV